MKRLALAVLAFVCLLVPTHGWAQAKTHHVLVALTSANPVDWNMTFGNVRNLKKGLAPDTVEVEIVVYGPGVVVAKKDSTAIADLQALLKDGVVIVACENSMRAHQLTIADLLPGIGTVPSGIVEVVKKQEAGWTYIKAGQ